MKVDSITVDSEAEATKLMLHHLHIAAMLFEATHDDNGAHAEELILKFAAIEQPAMVAFVQALVIAYNEYKDIGND